MRRCLVPLAAVGPLAAAVTGAPEVAADGRVPVAELQMGNDFFGRATDNGDDYRTWWARGGASGRWWVANVDYSALTVRDRPGERGRRGDELLATAGAKLEPEGPPGPGWFPVLALGGGLRRYGDLGGSRAQNTLHHDVIDIPTVDLPYDAPHTDGVAFAAGGVTWLTPALGGIGIPSLAGGQLRAALVAGAHGDTVSEIGLNAVLHGERAAGWWGGRWRGSSGAPPIPSAAEVADHEGGWWLGGGIAVWPQGWGDIGITVRSGVDPATHATDGAVGLVLREGPAKATGEGVDFAADVAGYGSGMGMQLRLMPWGWRSWHGDAWRLALVADYRSGTDAMVIWRDNELRFDQWLGGCEFALRSPAWHGCHLEPWVQALAGVRREAVVPFGPDPLYDQVGRTAGVVAADAGLRLSVCERWYIGGSWGWWQPLASPAHVGARDGTASGTYLLGGGTWGAHAGALVCW